MQKLQGAGRAGSGQRWQHGAGSWGCWDEWSRAMCSAKPPCCPHPARPVSTCILPRIGATCWGPRFVPEQASITPSRCRPRVRVPRWKHGGLQRCWGEGRGAHAALHTCVGRELQAAAIGRSRGSILLSVSTRARARGWPREQERVCWHRRAQGAGGQGPALRAHRGAFGEEHRRSSLRGDRPPHGHRPPPGVCRGGAWQAALWHYLFVC